MKPDFALILSHDGIALAHRTRAGWARLGEVSLDSEDLAGELAALRRRAQSLAPKGVLVKLVIPASQILYTAIYAPGPSPAQRRAQIEAALEGMTPYEVSDLVYDWVGTRQTVQVAVVARETLTEAETFAQSHGFEPICFVAIPMEGDFTGEPWFGLSAGAASYLPEGAQVERDTAALSELSDAIPEDATPETTPEATPDPDDSAATPEAETLPPASEAAPAPDTGSSDTDTPEAVGVDDTVHDVNPAENLSEDPPEATPDGTPAADGAPEDLPGPDPVDPPENVSDEDLADLAALDMAPNSPDPTPSDIAQEAEQMAEHAPPVAPRTGGETADTAATGPSPEESPEKDAPKTATGDPIAALDALSAFSSKRTDADTQNRAPAPKLGGVGRLSPPQPERKKILTGEAKITAPGLDLPEPAPLPETPAPRKAAGGAMKTAMKKGLKSGKAIGSAALSGSARTPKPGTGSTAPKTETQTEPAGETTAASAPETTVFGAQKWPDVGGKPRYLGASLIGALVLFLAIVALWTGFLSDDTAPEPQDRIAAAAPETPSSPAASETAMPAPDTATPDAVSPARPAPATAQAPAPDPNEATQASTPAPANAPQTQPEAAPEAPSPPTPAPEDDRQAAAPAAPSSLPPFTATLLAPPSTPPSTPAATAPETPVPESPATATATAEPVSPTPEGVEMPGGFTLFAGKPEVLPRARPATVSAAWRATLPPAPLRPRDTLAALPELAGVRPTARPASIAPPTSAAETATPARNDPALAGLRPQQRPAAISSKAQAGAATQDAPEDGAALTPPKDPRLAGLRPDARPASVQSLAQEATPEAAAPSDPFAGATALAVAASARPPVKPRNFARSVESALAAAIAAEPAPSRAATASAPKAAAPKAAPDLDEPEPTKPAPRLPTSASVARQATEKNVINLRDINLIGLYGSSSNRRALVRLKNGRFVKVGVGDRLNGGKVTAISATQLTYAKGARSYTLKLPQGG